MKIVAIKNMSAGNDTVGDMWQETKIFEGTDTLEQVMAWVKNQKKTVFLTGPDGEEFLELKIDSLLRED